MPRVNGKEYPYTKAGIAAAEKAKKKAKGQGGPTGKPKPSTGGKKILPGTGSVTKNQRMPDLRKSGGINGPAVKPKVSGSSTSRAIPKPPAMNKAIPGNKGGINIGSAAKKFIMTMPPVGPAVAAAKAGIATGKAIGNAMSKPSRPAPQLKRRVAPGKPILPKKMGR